jgi:hypothetical protein
VKRLVVLCAVLGLAPAPSAARGTSVPGSSDVAALQVALRAAREYTGTIDGREGPETTRAVVSFQQRHGLVVDGIAGPRTRRALGQLGSPELGARPLSLGDVGWDVTRLQFLLAWHGFPSGPFDGAFGTRLDAAVRRFQRFTGLPDIGIAGPRTIGALRRSALPTSPIRLALPLDAPLGDGFGPRGDAFHAGLDFIAAAGSIVAAAGSGLVTWAGPRGTFGNAVVIAHGHGVRSLYAHLSRIGVGVGQRVAAGAEIGLVGSTGRSSGPHLHFEVRLRGACIDPLSALR